MRIAVVGGGVSGNLAARLLHTQHDVTLFEAEARMGGHSHTHEVELGSRRWPVDTGFMVFNEKTYPNFCRLLKLLNVASQPTDMSFSVQCLATGLEYEGSSCNGLFAQRRNLLRPTFYRLLADIVRFNGAAPRVLHDDARDRHERVGNYLAHNGYSRAFIEQYLLPMSAAIWSCRPAQVLDFPLHFLVAFMHNHGLLQLRNRPTWRTVVGGAKRYVAALLQPLVENVRRQCPIVRVERQADHVIVVTSRGELLTFDHVVLATHADDTLTMLSDADEREREILGAFPYQANDAVLHSDTRLLPRRRRAWASWNYRIAKCANASATVTYDLARLQRHDTSTPLLLTLNETESINPATIIDRFAYRHPAFGADCLVAQRRWSEISGRHRVHFCGAYWGYGFHEDGVNSALRVAEHFGIGLDACTVASTKAKSRIDALVL